MKQYLRKSESVDVMIFAEGTYPFVQGGVSSWIHQLISKLPEFSFGICFVGSRESEYEGVLYELSENLVHLEAHFMFDELGEEPIFDHEKKGVIEEIERLHSWFKTGEGELPERLRKSSFYLEDADERFFLHSHDAWTFINKKYKEHCPDIPFIDYFWALRNMHRPIWLIASIVSELPRCGLCHSPSTGYAGFAASQASYEQDIPLFVTEHGIYTRERKIDLLNADWISYHKPMLLKSGEDINYIKQMWINFFIKIGEFAYRRAERVFSLYPQIQQTQQELGALPEKLEVIPNGVAVDKISVVLEDRPQDVPHVITLIGRVVSIKDIKTFIRAMRVVVERYPETEGWIVGPLDEDEEYAQECRDMVDTLGLQNNVKFLGFQNILKVLPETGILTLTSISEGMPLVILEGFAAGVPCVATDVGSCRNLIEGGLGEEDIAIGEAGIVTSIANPTELAEAYFRLFEDEELWYRMQKSALERVNHFYREEMFISKYRDYYKKALDHGRHRV